MSKKTSKNYSEKNAAMLNDGADDLLEDILEEENNENENNENENNENENNENENNENENNENENNNNSDSSKHEGKSVGNKAANSTTKIVQKIRNTLKNMINSSSAVVGKIASFLGINSKVATTIFTFITTGTLVIGGIAVFNMKTNTPSTEKAIIDDLCNDNYHIVKDYPREEVTVSKKSDTKSDVYRFKVDQRARAMYRYLKSIDYRDEAIAGIIANAFAETDCDPEAYEGDRGLRSTGNNDGNVVCDSDTLSILQKAHLYDWHSYAEALDKCGSVMDARGDVVSKNRSVGTVNYGTVPHEINGSYPGFGLFAVPGERAYDMVHFANCQADPKDRDGDGNNDIMWNMSFQIANLYFEDYNNTYATDGYGVNEWARNDSFTPDRTVVRDTINMGSDNDEIPVEDWDVQYCLKIFDKTNKRVMYQYFGVYFTEDSSYQTEKSGEEKSDECGYDYYGHLDKNTQGVYASTTPICTHNKDYTQIKITCQPVMYNIILPCDDNGNVKFSVSTNNLYAKMLQNFETYLSNTNGLLKTAMITIGKKDETDNYNNIKTLSDITDYVRDHPNENWVKEVKIARNPLLRERYDPNINNFDVTNASKQDSKTLFSLYDENRYDYSKDGDEYAIKEFRATVHKNWLCSDDLIARTDRDPYNLEDLEIPHSDNNDAYTAVKKLFNPNAADYKKNGSNALYYKYRGLVLAYNAALEQNKKINDAKTAADASNTTLDTANNAYSEAVQNFNANESKITEYENSFSNTNLSKFFGNPDTGIPMHLSAMDASDVRYGIVVRNSKFYLKCGSSSINLSGQISDANRKKIAGYLSNFGTSNAIIVSNLVVTDNGVAKLKVSNGKLTDDNLRDLIKLIYGNNIKHRSCPNKTSPRDYINYINKCNDDIQNIKRDYDTCVGQQAGLESDKAAKLNDKNTAQANRDAAVSNYNNAKNVVIDPKALLKADLNITNDDDGRLHQDFGTYKALDAPDVRLGNNDGLNLNVDNYASSKIWKLINSSSGNYKYYKKYMKLCNNNFSEYDGDSSTKINNYTDPMTNVSQSFTNWFAFYNYFKPGQIFQLGNDDYRYSHPGDRYRYVNSNYQEFSSDDNKFKDIENYKQDSDFMKILTGDTNSVTSKDGRGFDTYWYEWTPHAHHSSGFDTSNNRYVFDKSDNSNGVLSGINFQDKPEFNDISDINGPVYYAYLIDGQNKNQDEDTIPVFIRYRHRYGYSWDEHVFDNTDKHEPDTYIPDEGEGADGSKITSNSGSYAEFINGVRSYVYDRYVRYTNDHYGAGFKDNFYGEDGAPYKLIKRDDVYQSGEDIAYQDAVWFYKHWILDKYPGDNWEFNITGDELKRFKNHTDSARMWYRKIKTFHWYEEYQSLLCSDSRNTYTYKDVTTGSTMKESYCDAMYMFSNLKISLFGDADSMKGYSTVYKDRILSFLPYNPYKETYDYNNNRYTYEEYTAIQDIKDQGVFTEDKCFKNFVNNGNNKNNTPLRDSKGHFRYPTTYNDIAHDGLKDFYKRESCAEGNFINDSISLTAVSLAYPFKTSWYDVNDNYTCYDSLSSNNSSSNNSSSNNSSNNNSSNNNSSSNSTADDANTVYNYDNIVASMEGISINKKHSYDSDIKAIPSLFNNKNKLPFAKRCTSLYAAVYNICRDVYIEQNPDSDYAKADSYYYIGDDTAVAVAIHASGCDDWFPMNREAQKLYLDWDYLVSHPALNTAVADSDIDYDSFKLGYDDYDEMIDRIKGELNGDSGTQYTLLRQQLAQAYFGDVNTSGYDTVKPNYGRYMSYYRNMEVNEELEGISFHQKDAYVFNVEHSYSARWKYIGYLPSKATVDGASVNDTDKNNITLNLDSYSGSSDGDMLSTAHGLLNYDDLLPGDLVVGDKFTYIFVGKDAERKFKTLDEFQNTSKYAIYFGLYGSDSESTGPTCAASNVFYGVTESGNVKDNAITSVMDQNGGFTGNDVSFITDFASTDIKNYIDFKKGRYTGSDLEDISTKSKQVVEYVVYRNINADYEVSPYYQVLEHRNLRYYSDGSAKCTRNFGDKSYDDIKEVGRKAGYDTSDSSNSDSESD